MAVSLTSVSQVSCITQILSPFLIGGVCLLIVLKEEWRIFSSFYFLSFSAPRLFQNFPNAVSLNINANEIPFRNETL